MPVRAVAAPDRIRRFDALERVTHWAVAALVGTLVLTGAALYVPAVGGVVGRRALVADVHLWCGIGLAGVVGAALAGPWGRGLRRDLRRINRWSAAEVRWMASLGSRGGPVADKFNPGQKLHAIWVGAAGTVLLATGLVLRWFSFFPLSWRTGATFVHDVAAVSLAVTVTGHVVLAVTHPDALRSMVRGWVPEPWARRHAPGWLAEERPGRSGTA